ncbi:MAG: phospholipase D family protein [Rhizobiaceae bacterium]|nr:phospholipase D family protein [Rhizobiaceae bacterium]
MTVAIGVIAAFVLASLVSALGIYAYGRLARRPRGEASYALPLAQDDTPLDRLAAPMLEARKGWSGLVLCSDNLEAFAVRALTARAAGRSLDLQYYYWKTDLTGLLLAREIVHAADRGVRVRLLLDDINLRGKDGAYLALDRHPNIEVRVFNPSWNRVGTLQRGFELVFRAFSSTRRMHNKSWIADGRLAIVGGRNIGDAYFDASDTVNFRDLDLLALGSAVGQAESIFDTFWNSPSVQPLKVLRGWHDGDPAGLRDRMESTAASEAARPYVDRLREADSIQDLFSRKDRLHWSEKIAVLADPPAKSSGDGRSHWLYKSIFPLVTSATRSLQLTSPYFIPGARGVAQFASLVRRGVSVEVLTNSLAATDVAAVHGAYSRYRVPLLRAGVALYELKPDDERQKISLFGSRGASLHTKAFIVDGQAGFVGSFNFDPRSVSLNTEMGVIFHHPDLCAEVAEIFRQQIQPTSSFKVSLDGKRPAWTDDRKGKMRRLLGAEPDASLRRKLVATIAGRLPLESQL